MKGTCSPAGESEDQLLRQAGSCVSLASVESLINKRANVNTRDYMGQTPLIKAALVAECENTDVVRFLVDKGADVNVKNGNRRSALLLVDEKIKRGRLSLNTRGDVVFTPLTAAERVKYQEIEQILRSVGHVDLSNIILLLEKEGV